MQTAPLLPALNAAPTALAAPPRLQDNPGADQQFTQMLSRQMAERDAAKAASKAADGPRPVPQNVDVAVKPNPPTAPQEPDPAPAAATVSNSIDGAGSTGAKTLPGNPDDKVNRKDRGKVDGKVVSTAADAALDASAAIMALVANAGVAASAAATIQPVTGALTAASVAADPARVTGADRRNAGKLDLAAAADTGHGDSTAKELAAKGAATFDGALQLAAQAKADSGSDAAVPMTALPSTIDVATGATTDPNLLPPLQQAALALAVNVGPHPGDTLAPHLGGPNWDQSLGQRMIWMVAGAEQSASLTLNPPDLGPMQVVLHVSNGQADASFFSALPEVRQALEAALPKLREMLGEAGVTLGQTSVSAGNPQQQNAFGQSQSGDRRRDAGAVDNKAPALAGARRINGGNGLVDTFA